LAKYYFPKGYTPYNKIDRSKITPHLNPVEGEEARGIDIGKKNNIRIYIWTICPRCKEGRWQAKSEHDENRPLCRLCAVTKNGKEHPQFRGESRTDKKGYRLTWISKDNFFFSMAQQRCVGGGYVLEHRLIMAKHLKRNLHRWEIVHHINHNKSDNRIENLQLVSDDRHNQITILEKRISYLEGKLLNAGIKY